MANYEFSEDDKRFLRYLIRLRMETSKAMFLAEDSIGQPGQINIDQTGQVKEIKLFKRRLNQLLEQYYWRFDKRNDVDRPDSLEDNTEEGMPRVDNLEFKECKKVYYRIAELQEKLGHTTIESKEREEDGVGGK